MEFPFLSARKEISVVTVAHFRDFHGGLTGQMCSKENKADLARDLVFIEWRSANLSREPSSNRPFKNRPRSLSNMDSPTSESVPNPHKGMPEVGNKAQMCILYLPLGHTLAPRGCTMHTLALPSRHPLHFERLKGGYENSIWILLGLNEKSTKLEVLWGKLVTCGIRRQIFPNIYEKKITRDNDGTMDTVWDNSWKFH